LMRSIASAAMLVACLLAGPQAAFWLASTSVIGLRDPAGQLLHILTERALCPSFVCLSRLACETGEAEVCVRDGVLAPRAVSAVGAGGCAGNNGRPNLWRRMSSGTRLACSRSALVAHGARTQHEDSPSWALIGRLRRNFPHFTFPTSTIPTTHTFNALFSRDSDPNRNLSTGKCIGFFSLFLL